jgi:tetratricopeptide (TPR) repeat protein
MSTHRPFPISGNQNEEVLQELSRVRDESVGTRHVAIKTENMVKSLTVELKQISQRQTTLERRSMFNSAVAYVIFVLLSFTGLYLTFNANEAKFNAELEKKDSRVTNLENDVKRLKKELEEWKQIERQLLEFERLVREDNKEEAVKRYTQLRTVSFSGLLEELVKKFKGEVASEKYEQGKKSYDQRSFSPADKLFSDSMSYDESPPYLGDLLYYQGMCALRLEDFNRATELLTKAQTFKHDRKIKAHIDFHLARATDMLGDKAVARRLYYRFYLRYRHSEKHRAARAKRRYEQLDRSR